MTPEPTPVAGMLKGPKPDETPCEVIVTTAGLTRVATSTMGSPAGEAAGVGRGHDGAVADGVGRGRRRTGTGQTRDDRERGEAGREAGGDEGDGKHGRDRPDRAATGRCRNGGPRGAGDVGGVGAVAAKKGWSIGTSCGERLYGDWPYGEWLSMTHVLPAGNEMRLRAGCEPTTPSRPEARRAAAARRGKDAGPDRGGGTDRARALDVPDSTPCVEERCDPGGWIASLRRDDSKTDADL